MSVPTNDIKPYSVNPGEVIIEQGSAGSSLYYLLEGTLRAVIKTESENKIVGKIQKGEIFGEMSFLLNKTRTATIIAETKAKILEIPKESFEQSLKSKEPWLQKYITTLVHRISEVQDKII